MRVGLASRERTGISPKLVPMMPHAIVDRRPLTSDFPAMCRDGADTPLEFFFEGPGCVACSQPLYQLLPFATVAFAGRSSGILARGNQILHT